MSIIGTRGYPSFYGGFETAVRRLVPAFADAGWAVTVYGRPGAQRAGAARDRRAIVRTTRGLETKALSTLTYGLTAVIDAVRRRTQVALVMNVANGFWLPLLRLRGIPVAVNVDGIEWERAKWGRLARAVFRAGAWMTARFADVIIVDAEAIGDYWREKYGRESVFIPYGGDPAMETAVPFDLVDREYVLVVARFVPENTIGEFLDAIEMLPDDRDVVIVGSSGYGGELEERVARMADERNNVRWLGHLADDELLHALWSHAGVYFHGHSVGGTNPALVQAMALGAPTLALDTVYNREVLGQEHERFVHADAGEIARGISALLDDSSAQDRISARSQARAEGRYSWSTVTETYEATMRRLIRKG